VENFRLRMVFLGLVIGVLVAVIVASQGGCGTRHHRRHAGAGAMIVSEQFRAGRPMRHQFASFVRLARHHDPGGPFFDFRGAHLTRADAPRTRDVALTFDDGPGPWTPRVLDELRRLHVRATFFVVGSMAAIRPDDVRAEAHAGMEVENHTWSHAFMTALPAAGQRDQIESDNLVIKRLTGRRPRFFRPPGWRFSMGVARIVRRERMIGVLRTVDTRDWTLPGVRAIVRAALRVRPGGVIALHDAGGYTRAQTVAALPYIVRGLRRRHLRLVTISALYDGRR
jgi:peptidoglycan-N-acetylglucosamine deacetylase